MGYLGACTRRVVKRRSRPGGWASKIFLGSLTCVLPLGWWVSLTFPSQKALEIKTVPAVPAVSHGVTGTHNIASGVRNEVVNTPIVSDSNRSASKRPEDARGRDQMVSTVHILSIAKQQFILAQPHARSAISARNNPTSDLCIQRTWRTVATPAGERAWNCLRHSPGRPHHCFRNSSGRPHHRFRDRSQCYGHYGLQNPSYRSSKR